MGKFDLFFTSRDVGDRWFEHRNGFVLTTAAATLTGVPQNLTANAALAFGREYSNGDMLRIINSSDTTKIADVISQKRAADLTATTPRVRPVRGASDTVDWETYEFPSGSSVSIPYATTAELDIDLRDAPSGKYEYLIMWSGQVSANASSSSSSGHQIVETYLNVGGTVDDRTSGEDRCKTVINRYQPTAFENWFNVSGATTVTLESGDIHAARVKIVAANLLNYVKIRNQRIIAIRYMKETSVFAKFGSTTLDGRTAGTGSVTGATPAQIAGSSLDNGREYLFVGSAQWGGVTTGASGAVKSTLQYRLAGNSGDIALAKSCMFDDPRREVVRDGPTTVNGTWPTMFAAQSSGDIDSFKFEELSNAAATSFQHYWMLAAFDCPALTAATTATDTSTAQPTGQPTSWTDILSPTAATLAKQTEKVCILSTQLDTASTSWGTVTGKATVKPDFGSKNSPADRGAHTLDVNNEDYTIATAFLHRDTYLRGTAQTNLQIEFSASGSGTVSTDMNATATLFDETKFKTDTDDEDVEVLLEADTEQVLTSWTLITSTEGITTGYYALPDSSIEDVTGLNIAGVEFERVRSWTEYATRANAGEKGLFFFDDQLTLGGLFGAQKSLWATSVDDATSGATVIPTSAQVTPRITTPIRASIFGTDIIMPGAYDSDFPETPFIARISNVPSVSSTGADNDTANIGQIVMSNGDGFFDDIVAGRLWVGRRARVFIGYPSVSNKLTDFELLFEGELGIPEVNQNTATIRVFSTQDPLESSATLGDITAYEGKAESATETSTTIDAGAIYGSVLRATAYRSDPYSMTTAAQYVPQAGNNFTTAAAYLNQNDPPVSFTGTAAGARIANTEFPGGNVAGRQDVVYLDGRGLPFDHAGEICLDIIDRFSSLSSEFVDSYSFRSLDRRWLSKRRNYTTGGDSSPVDPPKIGVVIEPGSSVEAALKQVLTSVGATLHRTNSGKISAKLPNKAEGSLLGSGERSRYEWWAWPGDLASGYTTTQGGGFGGVPASYVGSAASDSTQRYLTAPVQLHGSGEYVFEFNASELSTTAIPPVNHMIVEVEIPNRTDRVKIFDSADPATNAIPLASAFSSTGFNWFWKHASGTFTVPDGITGLGCFRISVNDPNISRSLLLGLSQLFVSKVLVLNDTNAMPSGATLSAVQYSEVGSTFAVNPFRPEKASIVSVKARDAETMPTQSQDSRFSISSNSGGPVAGDDAAGIVWDRLDALSTQTIRAKVRAFALREAPRVGQYAKIDMDRIPGGNYPSDVWRIVAVSQPRATVRAYDLTVVKTMFPRPGTLV